MKKALSLILAVVMVALMAPFAAITTFATESGDQRSNPTLNQIYSVDFSAIKNDADLNSAGWHKINQAGNDKDTISYVDGGVKYTIGEVQNLMLDRVKFSAEQSYVVELDLIWGGETATASQSAELHFYHEDTTTPIAHGAVNAANGKCVWVYGGKDKYKVGYSTFYYDEDCTQAVGLDNGNRPSDADVSKLAQGEAVKYRIVINKGKVETAEMIIDGTTYYVRIKDANVVTVPNNGMFGLRGREKTNKGVELLLKSFNVYDVNAPKATAPTSVTYELDNATNGMADGTVKIKLPANHNTEKLNLYWGNESGKLTNYTMIGSVEVTPADTDISYKMIPNTIIPPEATKLMVYPYEPWNGENSVCTETAIAAAYVMPEEKPLVEFQVVSDTHYGRNDTWNARLKAMLEDVASNGANSNGLFVVGDVIQGETGNGGNVEKQQYQGFKDMCDSITGLPDVYLAMGNHESFGWSAPASDYRRGSIAAFLDNLRNNYEHIGIEHSWDQPFYDVDVNGFKFIVLGGTKMTNATKCELGEMQRQWLEATLAAADENKPVFIMLHQPMAKTVAYEEASGNDVVDLLDGEELKKVLDKYPNVVMFNAHTHYSFGNTAVKHMFGGGDSNVIFNTSSVGENGEGYYVQVYADRILVRGKNFSTGEWVSSAQFAVNDKFLISQQNPNDTTDGTDQQPDVTTTVATTTAATTAEEKKGCGSSIVAVPALIATAVLGCAVTVCKKNKEG